MDGAMEGNYLPGVLLTLPHSIEGEILVVFYKKIVTPSFPSEWYGRLSAGRPSNGKSSGIHRFLLLYENNMKRFSFPSIPKQKIASSSSSMLHSCKWINYNVRRQNIPENSIIQYNKIFYKCLWWINSLLSHGDKQIIYCATAIISVFTILANSAATPI